MTALEALPDALRLSYDEAIKRMRPLSENQEFTVAILLRLRAYYRMQDKINKFLGKQVKGNAADFFVETINFYLRVFLELNQILLDVKSEKKVSSHLRPDISVWQGQNPVLFIECKTQLVFELS